MKKLLFLMLLLSSKLIFCQNTNTNLSEKNCFSDERVTELFNGLKQGEELKKKLIQLQNSYDNALSNADAVIKSQKNTIAKYEQESVAKDNLIAVNESLCSADKDILNIKIEKIDRELSFTKSQAKSEKKRSFWNGLKTGGAGAILLTAAAIIFIK